MKRCDVRFFPNCPAKLTVRISGSCEVQFIITSTRTKQLIPNEQTYPHAKGFVLSKTRAAAARAGNHCCHNNASKTSANSSKCFTNLSSFNPHNNCLGWIPFTDEKTEAREVKPALMAPWEATSSSAGGEKDEAVCSRKVGNLESHTPAFSLWSSAWHIQDYPLIQSLRDGFVPTTIIQNTHLLEVPNLA